MFWYIQRFWILGLAILFLIVGFLLGTSQPTKKISLESTFHKSSPFSVKILTASEGAVVFGGRSNASS
jgi:hypothetical protein